MDRTERRPDGYRRTPPARNYEQGDVRLPVMPSPYEDQSADYPPDHDDLADQLPIQERG